MSFGSWVKVDRRVAVATPPYKGFRGCFAVAASNVLQVDFLMVIAMDFGTQTLRFYSQSDGVSSGLFIDGDQCLQNMFVPSLAYLNAGL